MNRKIILSIALVTIVALAVACGFCYNQIRIQQNQISELQDQNSELQAQNSDLQNQIRDLQANISELQDQNSELQNQLIELENMINIARDVKITNFEWIGDYHSLGQVNLFQNFKVTIQNMGNNNVSGLTLSVKLLSVETNAEIDEYTTQINITRAGQIMEIYGDVSVGNIGGYARTAVGVITLTLGDVLLDEWTRTLQGSF
jgi:septal ring factor EnvC (AmiA/AmiB activator)